VDIGGRVGGRIGGSAAVVAAGEGTVVGGYCRRGKGSCSGEDVVSVDYMWARAKTSCRKVGEERGFFFNLTHEVGTGTNDAEVE
jgi:hypothetical protein